jgi:Uma2 family endonuclease
MSPPATATPVTYRDAASLARFSVARYQQMIEHGILKPDDKVELLENYVVLRMARTPLHDGTIQLVTRTLDSALPHPWRLRVLSSVVLSDSQPEPDFAVVRGDARAYLTRHPGPADVGLLIEVADASLLRDQRDKTRIYARAGIPSYWIVNLVDMRIEAYAQPSGPAAVPAYGSFQTYQPGDAIPLVLDGNTVGTIPVADLLP